MGEVINLRGRRKQAKRRRDEDAAAANRLAHGVGKAERNASEQQRDKAARDLEQHRLDTPDRHCEGREAQPKRDEAIQDLGETRLLRYARKDDDHSDK